MAAQSEERVVSEDAQPVSDWYAACLLLWLDTVVQLELHRAGDNDGAALVRSLADRIDAGEPFGLSGGEPL